MAEEYNINEGLTRREILKKGAMFGGTLMWVAPVVQAVGMSPAMAAIPSETSCCLRLGSTNDVTIPALVASPAAGTDGDDFTIVLTVQNCSTQLTAYNVRGRLQRLPVVGGSPDTGSAVELPEGGGSPFVIGQVNPAQTADDGFTDGDLSAGTWIYRAHGLYWCPANEGPDRDHDVPSDFWVYSNQVVVTP